MVLTSSGPFDVVETSIAGVHVVTRRRIGDRRGFLSRIYCADAFRDIGLEHPVVQINQTHTALKGTVRGLHFQFPPAAEDKFVSVLHGAIFDVAVDIRRDSPTFLAWHGEVLTAEAMNSLFIPRGCAHGFQTLIDDCELLYLHTAPYAPAVERGLSPSDPRLAIRWPAPITEMSERDRSHPLIDDHYAGISL